MLADLRDEWDAENRSLQFSNVRWQNNHFQMYFLAT